jgi:hypothetical protein
MTNDLKQYVRDTIMQAAIDYSDTDIATEKSTREAFTDAMRGTNTGWWNDLIYTAPMLKMAYKHRRDIATALNDYRDATGESFTSRDGITAETILESLILFSPDDFDFGDSEDMTDAALLGLCFAVEWFASDVASEMGGEI